MYHYLAGAGVVFAYSGGFVLRQPPEEGGSQTGGWVDRQVDEWTDRWVDEWTGRWVDEWTGRWVDK